MFTRTLNIYIRWLIASVLIPRHCVIAMLSATFQVIRSKKISRVVFTPRIIFGFATHKLPRSVGLPSTFMCGRIKMSWNETGRNQATCSQHSTYIFTIVGLQQQWSDPTLDCDGFFYKLRTCTLIGYWQHTLTPVLKRMLVTSAWKLYFCKAFFKLA